MTPRPPLAAGWKRAAGELLLIIACVLMALWIEDWRQARIDRATELEHLSRLEIDISEDITAAAAMGSRP